MHSTNYFSTLICPAEDCKAVAKIPDKAGSAAAMQYEMLIDAPYQLTSDDALSRVAAARKSINADGAEAFRETYLAKGQPCFRASPLTKTHGWAIHSDAQGRIALVNPTGEAFAKLQADPAIKQVQAMRNARKS